MLVQNSGYNPWTQETSLDDLLDDPTMHTFLKRDRLSVDDVRGIVNEVRQRFAGA